MFAYYTSLFILVEMIGNCILVPHHALTPDLAMSYDHATRLTEWRVITYTIFGILVVLGHSYLIAAFPLPPVPLQNVTTHKDDDVLIDYQRGYSVSAAIWASIFAILPILAGLFLEERPMSQEQRYNSTKKGIWNNIKDLFSTFERKEFVCVSIMYFFCWTSVQLVQNNFFLFVKYVLELEEHFMYLIMVVLVSSAPSAYFWSKMTLCCGKRNTYLVGGFYWILIMSALFFVNKHTQIWINYLLASAAGICIGIGFLLPWSMLPDVIDKDELITGIRREGAFYSIFTLVQKLGLAVALGGSSWALGLAGYDSGEAGLPVPHQPELVLLTLRIMSGPLCSLMIFISLLPMLFYKLSREDVLEIRKKLREGENDPWLCCY
eukprot:TRINITY_DN7989_c0_g3_i2.p1 TRINITY_DN7989_c0_g3~~TRINITY_DN7989_c0_g3_i2.p1  ORF type:complete len:378 (-),score=55.16 TRINITY_DN7989_c0_g3_i2:599-1732(-)